MDATPETVGVIVVPEGFDARTPIGGLRPLARHVLGLQSAGVTRVLVVGAARDEDWRRGGITVEVDVVASAPALHASRVLVVDAETSLHRAALAYVMSVLDDRDRAGEEDGGAVPATRAWRGDEARVVASEGSELPALIDNWAATQVEPRGDDLRLPEELFAVRARTPRERSRATSLHLVSLSKTTGGPLDRYLMRPVTRQLTRLLCRTPVTPNMITVVSLGLALVAAYLVSLPAQRWSVIAAGVMIAVRFVDCLDGELARLRYEGSRLGAWLDTLGDGVGVFAFVLGTLVHAVRAVPEGSAHAERLVGVGVVGLLAWVAVQVFQVAASRRVSGSGSVQELAWGHLQVERTGVERLMGALAVFARIDVIGVGYALFVGFGQHQTLLWVHAISASVGASYFGAQLLVGRVRRL